MRFEFQQLLAAKKSKPGTSAKPRISQSVGAKQSSSSNEIHVELSSSEDDKADATMQEGSNKSTDKDPSLSESDLKA